MVEHVGGLLVDALVGLLARRAGDLLGLLPHLRADPRRVVEQLDGVGALGPLGAARSASVRSSAGSASCGARRLELAVVEARALAGVARRAGGLDEREQRVAVAVQAQRPDAPACCPRSRPCATARRASGSSRCSSPVSRVRATASALA